MFAAKDLILRDGIANVYRFRRPEGAAEPGTPLLLVPSLINRWYILDLREGASLAHALVSSGLDVFCLDWGVPEDEDRYTTWDDVVARLLRAVRRVKRVTGAPKVGVLGYCMGGTVSAIGAALRPDDVAALVNLAGPIDFSEGGMLKTMVDPRWFDARAIGEAGNVAAQQMQAGFLALRPTGTLAKWVHVAEKLGDPDAVAAFTSLEAWASDNVPFPGAAYVTYIEELYQKNTLVKGTHAALGERVDLEHIRCPILTITADKDTICPPKAALALADHVSSKDKHALSVPGGHVGAVVGAKAKTALYPAMAAWLRERLDAGVGSARAAPLA